MLIVSDDVLCLDGSNHQPVNKFIEALIFFWIGMGCIAIDLLSTAHWTIPGTIVGVKFFDRTINFGGDGSP